MLFKNKNTFIRYEESTEFFKEEVEWKTKREKMKGIKGKVWMYESPGNVLL